MDLWTIATAIISSASVTLAAARYLAKGWVDNQFAKELQLHQAELDERLATSQASMDRQLAAARAEMDAAFRKEVEEYLGDRAADRQYRLDAKKRLYQAVGPLRFQLAIACADFAGRVGRIGRGTQRYDTSIEGYFGSSTAYRLLRIFALTELIERQVAYADFSVDPSIAGLLRFKNAASLCLSSSTVSRGHPAERWDAQVEHVFYDRLSLIAAALIVREDGTPAERTVRFQEFLQLIAEPDQLAALAPIPTLLEDFTVGSKPILWLRLVSLGNLCSAFVDREGPQLGITPEPFDARLLLEACGDAHICEQVEAYLGMLETMAERSKSPAG